MTTYPHVEHYHEELRQLIEFGGSDNEQSIRRAFESCLTAYCREHGKKIELVAHRLHGNCLVGSSRCAQRRTETDDRIATDIRLREIPPGNYPLVFPGSDTTFEPVDGRPSSILD